jgi:hypothetical protein
MPTQILFFNRSVPRCTGVARRGAAFFSTAFLRRIALAFSYSEGDGGLRECIGRAIYRSPAILSASPLFLISSLERM